MITDYPSLCEAVAKHLNRTDLYDAIPTFVQLAEVRLRDDERTSRVATVPAVLDGPEYELPPDFGQLVSWDVQVGPSRFHSLEVPGPGSVADLRSRFIAHTAPRFVVIEGGTAHLIPAPKEEYASELKYRRKIEPLGPDNPSNWLLEERPDIYLYAALAESAPYLKEDPRVAVWEGVLQQRLDQYEYAVNREMYSGRMRRKPRRPIGG